jgi:hypothetical protein
MEDIKPRRPASSRPRPASARPAAVEEPKPDDTEDDGIFDDNETWLFSIQVSGAVRNVENHQFDFLSFSSNSSMTGSDDHR